MKSYEEFLIEYTNAQLAQGGTSAQRAIAQTRQRKREEQQRQKERDQKRLGNALARRSGSTSMTRPKGGPLATRSSAITKRTPNSSAIVPSSSRRAPRASRPDEKQTGTNPYSYNRGVTTLPDRDKKKKKSKVKQCPFGQVYIGGECRGLPRSKVSDNNVSASGDLEGIGTRNSLAKVD